ncbi:MAG: hypothetical protein HYV28_12970 [Ignavibacteriales bacterium]|nr:hypothetical protein [Ignavibacteriales bacterium]
MSTTTTYQNDEAFTGRGRILSFPFINLPLEIVVLGILLVVAILGIIAIIG